MLLLSNSVSVALVIVIASCITNGVTGRRGIGQLSPTAVGPTRQPFDQAPSKLARSLIARTTQSKCIWYSSGSNTVEDGRCEVNDYFILAMRGAPPSYSSRILAYMSYKAYICESHRTESACLSNASDACAWDRATAASAGASACYISASALYDIEVLRGRLYCEGSLLDTAARCALANPGADGCTAAGADCTFLGATQLTALGGGGGGGTAAAPAAAAFARALSYLRLVDLVTFTDAAAAAEAAAAAAEAAAAAAEATESAAAGGGGDGDGGAGVCVADWLLRETTLERLGGSVKANPEYGLLQRDLLGTCNGTDWLAKALADATASCTAAAAGAAAGQEACAAATSCRWDAVRGTCEAEYFWLYGALYDMTDSWVRALRDAAGDCSSETSSDACEAAGAAAAFTVDPELMRQFSTILSDLNWGSGSPEGPGGGGGGGAGSAARSSWLMMLIAGAAALLLGNAAAGTGGGQYSTGL